MGEKLHLHLLARDMGLFVPIIRYSPRSVDIRHIGPSGWEETTSYCVTSSGDLWACVAGGSFLLRRSKDGSYSIAIANNSVEFAEYLPGKRQTDRPISVSGIAALADGTLLLVGPVGLYRLKGRELVQELAFTAENWSPNSVLALDERSYVIGTAEWRGVYLLRKSDNSRWSVLPLDDVRDLVVW